VVIIVVIVVASVTVGLVIVSDILVGPWGPNSTYPPLLLNMASRGYSEPAAGVFYIAVGLNPASGLTTALFALKIGNNTTGLVAPGSASTSCQGPSGSTYTAFIAGNCGAPSGNWYAVLVLGNGTVASVFDSSGVWSGPSVVLQDTMQIYIVSGTNYTEPGNYLAAFAAASVSVAGSLWL